MRLLLEDTMALIVDYQERLMPVIYEHDELEKKSCTLLKGLRTLGVPMVMTQQYTKGIGMTIPSITEAAGISEYFDKITFSCFEDEAVRSKMEALGKKTGHRLHQFPQGF